MQVHVPEARDQTFAATVDASRVVRRRKLGHGAQGLDPISHHENAHTRAHHALNDIHNGDVVQKEHILPLTVRSSAGSEHISNGQPKERVCPHP